MNQLINDIFGDKFISLICEGGECLHYSQVPGYIVRAKGLSLRPILSMDFIEAAQTKQHSLDRIERGRSRSNCRFDFGRCVMPCLFVSLC